MIKTAGIFVVCGALALAVQASQSQQLVLVVRRFTSPPSVSVWNAFVRVSEQKGCSYVSLVQMAALFDGHLHWRPVAKQVDMTVRGHRLRFFYDNPKVLLDGRKIVLPQPTFRNEEGFWVPMQLFASRDFDRLIQARLDWPPPVSEPRAASSKQPAGGPQAASTKQQPKTTEDVPRLPLAASRSQAATPLAVRSANAIRRIVIDPGHGGKDPGTVSARGIEEKTINLLMAQELADTLREKEGYEVLMTRTDDTFIPLEDRAKLANQHNADLFISLHCNASLSTKLKGFEVYFLSERASDPHADDVARLENAPLALEGKGPSPREVEAVLRSLVKTAYINESSSVGSLIDREVAKRLSEPSLGVKQAAFYVLRGAEMPSVLVEAGFLSNPKEAKLLQKASFRARLIDGLLEGIKAYDQRKRQERR